MSEFDIEIFYNEGIKNQAVNVSSRLKKQGKDNNDVNDDITVAIIGLDEDRNEATKFSSYIVCHVCHHKDNKAGITMPDVQVYVRREDFKWDRPPMMTEFKADQAQDSTCQQYDATIGPHNRCSTSIIMDS